jgi:hypothetical protein
MTPPLPSPAKLPGPPLVPVVAHAGLLDVVVGEVVGETVGIVGTDELGTALPTMGNTLGSGTAGMELTPRLPISKDPNGIPVRAAPPGVVGDVDVGLEDAVMLFEPDPHIPDITDVSNTPVDPVLTGMSDVIEDVEVPDAAAALVGAAVPAPIPPPSKLAVDPNIPDGEVAIIEHAVLPLVVGIVIVPVTPVGTGLTPGDVISVAPNGIPVGDPPEPAATPSGEVAPIVGVGATVPSNCSSTCARATLHTTSAGTAAASNATLSETFLLMPASLRRGPIDEAGANSFFITAASCSEAFRATWRSDERRLRRCHG